MNDQCQLDAAMALRTGLLAWKDADPLVDRRALVKAMRDNWDRRIGSAKFGGVWSVSKARTNLLHPASKEALKIGRDTWTGKTVTVEHAVPIRVLFDAFISANDDASMNAVIDCYNVAVVTAFEDQRLRDAGLTSKMPEGWEWGQNPLARWNAVGIIV